MNAGQKFREKFEQKTRIPFRTSAAALLEVWRKSDDDAVFAAWDGNTVAASHLMEKTDNFMRQFRNKTSQEILSVGASQLLAIWSHYDLDGNGYIEGAELDQFLKEFVSSVCNTDVGNEVVSAAMLSELKQDFLDAYDDNDDGKIEIRELAQLLPTDENFLLLFQLDNQLKSSVEFMRMWEKYDKDKNGEIEATELKSFLSDLLEKTSGKSVPDDKLSEYVEAIIKIFDENHDGKLQLCEMARLLPVKENVLSAALSKDFFMGAKDVNYTDIEKIFVAYDKDKSGTLEGDEISGFVKDMLEMMKPNFTADELKDFEKLLMKSCDLDGDGKICKEELTIMLLGIKKFKKPQK